MATGITVVPTEQCPGSVIRVLDILGVWSVGEITRMGLRSCGRDGGSARAGSNGEKNLWGGDSLKGERAGGSVGS